MLQSIKTFVWEDNNTKMKTNFVIEAVLRLGGKKNQKLLLKMRLMDLTTSDTILIFECNVFTDGISEGGM